MPSKTVSCVIAAYNEEKGIGTVLKAVSGHPMITEVIVVDDGSKDRTAEIVRQFPGVKLIIHPVNKGKTLTVADGIAAAQGDYICALDADLIGITEESVTRLIRPVTEGLATVSISLRENCPWFYRPFHLDYISGERVYPKHLLSDHLDAMRKLPKFGLEVFMNQLIIKQQLPIAIVYLPNVVSPLKYSKAGFFAGLKGDIGMIRDIFKTVSLKECFSEIFHLMKLRVVIPAHFYESSSK
jgi:glycosyltransferase involved in cell wall biosynthesis